MAWTNQSIRQHIGGYCRQLLQPNREASLRQRTVCGATTCPNCTRGWHAATHRSSLYNRARRCLDTAWTTVQQHPNIDIDCARHCLVQWGNVINVLVESIHSSLHYRTSGPPISFPSGVTVVDCSCWPTIIFRSTWLPCPTGEHRQSNICSILDSWSRHRADCIEWFIQTADTVKPSGNASIQRSSSTVIHRDSTLTLSSVYHAAAAATQLSDSPVVSCLRCRRVGAVATSSEYTWSGDVIVGGGCVVVVVVNINLSHS